MALAHKKPRLNVFEKNPEIGSKLFEDILQDRTNCSEAARIFNDNGIKIGARSIQKTVNAYKERHGIGRPKPTQTIIPAGPQPKPDKTFKSYLSDIRAEFDAIDYNDVKKINPVVIMYKNLMKLEILMSKMQFDNDIKGLGDIIELERKIALEIHKIAPNTEEIDYNDLFRKNDLTVNFIMQLDQEKPNLDIKQSWLEFIRNQE